LASLLVVPQGFAITTASVPSLKNRSILCGKTQDTTAPQRCRTVQQQQQQQQTAMRAASRVRDKPCGQQVRTVAPTALAVSLSATAGRLPVCQSTCHTNPPVPRPILFQRYSLHMYLRFITVNTKPSHLVLS